MTSQTSELVARLVHQAYEEGFGDGCTVEAGEAAMPHYEETEAYRKTKLLLERLSSSEVTEEWLPIESAPKDGTPVLLGYFRENLDGSIYEEGSEPIVGRWVERIRRPSGWVARRERLNSEGPFSPSHWRRCPEPPRSAATSERKG